MQDLTIEVTGDDGPVRLVDGVSFEVHQDEVFALVGESGSGKSLTVLAIMDLLPPGVRIASGRILFRGRDLARCPNPRCAASAARTWPWCSRTRCPP